MVQSRHGARVASRAVLKGLAVAGAYASVLVAPNSAQLIDIYLKKVRKSDAKRTLYYLKYQKLIEVQKKDGELYYKLTRKGLDAYERIVLDELTIKTPLRWDSKWRMVMFDIPTEKKAQRAALLRRLKQLNFYKLQQSTWIHPFECEKQIGALLNVLKIERHAAYLVVERGNFVEHAEQYFKKQRLLV